MAYIFGSIWDRFNRNALNALSKSVEQQGKTIQDLVAEGQLTPTQYATLIQYVNGLISKGDVAFSDIDINKGKLLPKHLSEEVLKMVTGDAPINAVPADKSITNIKMADNSVDRAILSPNFMNSGRIPTDESIDTVMEDGNYIITAGNTGTFPKNESPNQSWCMSVVTTGDWCKQTLYKLEEPNIIYRRTINRITLYLYSWETNELKLYKRRIEIGESIDTVMEDGNYIITSGNTGTFPNGNNIGSYYLKVEVINNYWVQQYLYGLMDESLMYKRAFHATNPKTEKDFAWDRIVTESYLESRLPVFDGGGGNVSGFSKWTNKEVTVFGDSNSQNSGVTTWHEFMKTNLNLSTNIFAVGGAGYISKGSQGTTPNIPEQIEISTGNPDLVIIFSGGNDYAIGTPLGQFGDTTMDTLYGALDISYKEAINKYPLSTICVFTQTRRANEGKNTAGVSVEDQVNAQIEVAGKYSLPVLNLYHAGNVHPWNTTYRENRIPDGVHLSTEGHRVLASKVKAFIETL